jgi:hypothetical protein
VATVADEELCEPVARSGEVLADVVASADEITHRFLLCGGNGDCGELAGTKEARELARVAAVGLHAVARSHWDQRRRNDFALDAHRGELPVHLESARTCLVTAAELVRITCEPLERSPDDLRIVRDVAEHRLLRLSLEGGDDDPLGVHVQTNVSDNLLHGRLLRLRLWPRGCLRTARLTRAFAQ